MMICGNMCVGVLLGFYLLEQILELCMLAGTVHANRDSLGARAFLQKKQTTFAVHKLFWSEEDPSLFKEREYH